MQKVKRFFTHIVALISISAILFSLVPKESFIAEAQTISFSGYGWSSNIGWMQVEGTNYGIKATAVGDRINLSGYAWTSTIGWISFESTALSLASGCDNNVFGEQSGATNCLPYIDMSGSGPYRVRGFARACAVFVNGCSGVLKSATLAGQAELGGWDGYISLNSGDGAWGWRLSENKTQVTGYAWGDQVVGWLDINATCTGCDDDPITEDTFAGKGCALEPDYYPVFRWSTKPLAQSCTLISPNGSQITVDPSTLEYQARETSFVVPVSNGVYKLECTRGGVSALVGEVPMGRCQNNFCPDGTPRPPSGICSTDTCPDGTPLPPNRICPNDPCPNNAPRNKDGSCPVAPTCPDGSPLPANRICPGNPCPNNAPRNANGQCPSGRGPRIIEL